MKKFVRTPWVQSALAWLTSVYLGAAIGTIRWRFENRAAVDAVVASPKGIIGCFWHGRIALAVVCRQVLGKKPRRVIISNSPDGEFIAKVVARFDLPAIRGSSTTDSRRDRRSFEAFLGAVRFVDKGGVVVITPDGPRGPAQVMPTGPIEMARVRETPVFLFGIAATPTLSLRTWDQTRIPLPFGRGCVVFDGPLSVPHASDPDAVEALRAEWERRLTAAQERAEAILAGR